MRVDVGGESPVMTTPEWKRAVTWYGEHLLGQRVSDKVSVFLELVPHIRGNAGSISCADWRRRNKFRLMIETGTAGIRKQLYTLGHEMTHLRQIVAGELCVCRSTVVWRKDHGPRLDPDDPCKGCTFSKACQLLAGEPWEDEAYAAERPLYRLFKDR